jgi:hypothetical protein
VRLSYKHPATTLTTDEAISAVRRRFVPAHAQSFFLLLYRQFRASAHFFPAGVKDIWKGFFLTSMTLPCSSRIAQPFLW